MEKSANRFLPIRIEKLTKQFGALKAAKNVSLEVRRGEIFGLLGPNGAGKSTTIKILMGLEKADSGKIWVFDRLSSKNQVFLKSQIGYVPQEIITYSFFRVEELLHIISLEYGIKNNKAHIEQLIQRFRLERHRKHTINKLSGGIKRRLMIARALLHKPKIILLDEPTAGVDVELRDDIWKLILDLKRQGYSILLTTHYLEEAEALCDRICFMDKGNILLTESKTSILTKLATKKMTLTFDEINDDFKHPFIKKVLDNTLFLEVPLEMQLNGVLKQLNLSKNNLIDVETKLGNLHDVYRKIIS